MQLVILVILVIGPHYTIVFNAASKLCFKIEFPFLTQKPIIELPYTLVLHNCKGDS